MKNEFIAAIGRLSLGMFVVLALSFNSYAASCNPRAAVHQQRAQNIQMQVGFGNIPTKDEEDFVVCMLKEKEDKAAFRARVQWLKNQQQAAQAQEAKRQRQAAIEAARPESPAEHQEHEAICNGINNWPQGSENRASFQQYCMSLWAAQPHSQCRPSMVGINLPCGNSCFDPNSNVCQNGRIVQRSSPPPPPPPPKRPAVFSKEGKNDNDTQPDESECAMAEINGQLKGKTWIDCMVQKGWKVTP